MKETMTQSNVYASEIPEFPDEVTLTQAIGLIPKIAPLATDAAMKARLQIDDPVIRVFALETLIRRNADFDYDTLKMALHVAPKSAHLRQLLISELLQLFRFDLIDKVIKLEYEAASKTFVRRSELMRCEHNADFARQAKLHELLYLDTGNILHLEKAVELARLRLTWKQGAIHIVRSVFVQSEQSLEPTVLSLLQCLERNGAKGEFLSILPIIQKLDSCPIARAYGTSLRYIWNKKYHECLEFLKKKQRIRCNKRSLAAVFQFSCEVLRKFRSIYPRCSIF